MNFEASKDKVAALTNPRNVVLVGASDRAGSWAPRVWRSLRRNAFPHRVFPMNPSRDELWGEPCYPNFAALPEPPDHLVVLVPAAHVPDVLTKGAAAGARSATIFSAGFGEAGDPDGLELGRRLKAVIERTGLAVSGPNCMGSICAKSRLVTLVEERAHAMRPGPIALVGQSGGVMMFLNHTLEERALWPSYLITSGNEAGLSIADYIAFFAAEPEVKVVLVYIEAVADVARLQAACRLVRDAGKYVVGIKLGQSDAGRAAALAHTGALAGRIEAFDAVMAECGVIRAGTLDDAVEITELLVHGTAPAGRRLGAITLSGAYRGLLLDAAAHSGLHFPPLAAQTTERLQGLLSVGSHVSNPVDGGYGVVSSADTFMACLDALNDDENVDAILLQDALPRDPGNARAEKHVGLVEAYVTSKARKPILFTTMVSHGQTDHSRAIRNAAPHVAFLQEPNKALRALASVVRRTELLALTAASSGPRDAGRRSDALQQIGSFATELDGAEALDEVRSKRLLRAYGIATPDEELATTAADAIAAAERLGYPVVLKAVSARLPHKSDAGAVVLGLASADAVRAAYDRIGHNVAKHGVVADGVLVCRQVKAGLELAIGLHRDPEMGTVIMVGAGGVLIEMLNDVAFGAPPITREKARDMLAQTRIAALLRGVRGAPALDAEAVIDALIAIGTMAEDLGDQIDTIDINPFAVLPAGQGGLALDGLVVLRQRAAAPDA
jgi:acetyltransferase